MQSRKTAIGKRTGKLVGQAIVRVASRAARSFKEKHEPPADRRYGPQLPSPVHRRLTPPARCPLGVRFASASQCTSLVQARRKRIEVVHRARWPPRSPRFATVCPVCAEVTSSFLPAAIRTCLLSPDTCSPTDSRLHSAPELPTQLHLSCAVIFGREQSLPNSGSSPGIRGGAMLLRSAMGEAPMD